MNAELVQLSVEIAGAFPRSDKHVRKTLAGINKAAAGVSAARCYLEELLADDFPDEFNTRIYYGGERGDDETR
jgi:hypothetical protein